MNHISKCFTGDDKYQLVLEQENYSEYVWKAILDIFGLTDTDKIVISEYSLEAWGGEYNHEN